MDVDLRIRNAELSDAAELAALASSDTKRSLRKWSCVWYPF
jgi:hypothetical protein